MVEVGSPADSSRGSSLIYKKVMILKSTTTILAWTTYIIYWWDIHAILIIVYAILCVIDSFLWRSLARRLGVVTSHAMSWGGERKATQWVISISIFLLISVVSSWISNNLLLYPLWFLSIIPLLWFTIVQLHSIVELWDIWTKAPFEKKFLAFIKKILWIGMTGIQLKTERYVKKVIQETELSENKIDNVLDNPEDYE